MRYDQHDPKPIPRFAPFVAAGYFVAHSKFLVDVPFDPLLPWIFMGEEVRMVTSRKKTGRRLIVSFNRFR